MYEVDKVIGELIEEVYAFDEPTMVVLFGDHLPNLGLSSKDVASGRLTATEYVVWSNFEKQAEDKNLESYQLAAHVLKMMDMEGGYIMALHQNAMDDEDYMDKLYEVLLEIPDYTYDDPIEYAYRKWALDNVLFLNTLNDLLDLKLRFAADVIQLPSITADVGAKPVFHGMFNQINQEYIYARYLSYSSLDIPGVPHYADKETYLLNLTDYPQYSIRIENLKTA